jgi:hypothetical protein
LSGTNPAADPKQIPSISTVEAGLNYFQVPGLFLQLEVLDMHLNIQEVRKINE